MQPAGTIVAKQLTGGAALSEDQKQQIQYQKEVCIVYAVALIL